MAPVVDFRRLRHYDRQSTYAPPERRQHASKTNTRKIKKEPGRAWPRRRRPAKVPLARTARSISSYVAVRQCVERRLLGVSATTRAYHQHHHRSIDRRSATQRRRTYVRMHE